MGVRVTRSMESQLAGSAGVFLAFIGQKKFPAVITLGRGCVHLILLFVHVFVVLAYSTQCTASPSWSWVMDWLSDHTHPVYHQQTLLLPGDVELNPGPIEDLCLAACNHGRREARRNDPLLIVYAPAGTMRIVLELRPTLIMESGRVWTVTKRLPVWPALQI